MASTRAYILTLNIFRQTGGTDENEHERKSNVIATRIYLIVFILMLTVVALGSWLTTQTMIYTIPHPTQDQVNSLPADRQCACSHLSLNYGDFVTLETSFHPVCSSDLVSDRWIRAIFPGENISKFFQGDFRTIGSAQFQALAGLCRLSKENVQVILDSLYATSLISSQLLSENVFKSEVTAIIEQFQLTMHTTFRLQLQLINRMIFGNQLLSGLRSSVSPWFSDSGPTDSVYSFGISYQGTSGSLCTCSSDYNCVGSSAIYDVFDAHGYVYTSESKPVLAIIPGWSSGCMPMNSLLLATLECFCNQTCLDDLLAFFPVAETFTAIQGLEQSTYKPNSTLQSIVDFNMVEQWVVNMSYEKYFAQCEPISCTYSKVERHGLVFVLMKLVSVLGGLTMILRLVIPASVRFARRPKSTKREPSPRIPRT